MIEIVNGIIIISLIIIIYKYFEKNSYDVVMVESKTNGKQYLVRNLPDKQDASNLLGNIEIKLEKLVEIIKSEGYENVYKKYIKTDVDKETSTSNVNSNRDLIEGQEGGSSDRQNLENDMKMKLKEDIERLVSNFNPNAFSETTPDSKYTSYSVNKGEKIVFCIRDKKDGENLVKENIMTFVAIHELGHLMTKSIGHKSEFWENFKFLLENAKSAGIHDPTDYKKSPEKYCGMTIHDNPYFDV